MEPNIHAKLKTLMLRFEAKTENAYSDHIGLCSAEDCIGWKIKIDRGLFGRDELAALELAAEYLGRYKAMKEITEELRTMLEFEK